METAQIPEKPTEERSEYAGVVRYYELAKRAEWQVRDLPWNDLPPIPEYKGSPQKLARRRDLWRSVVTQQLQADELAVEMATQLFRMAPDPEAKLTPRRGSSSSRIAVGEASPTPTSTSSRRCRSRRTRSRRRS